MAGNQWMAQNALTTTGDTTPARHRDVADEVGGLLKRMEREIMAALPRTAGMTPERLARIALTTLRTTPELMRCSVPSLLGALVQCAQLGLEPDPRLGRAYLVPYKGNAQLIVGYRGMIELAMRSGEVASIEAHVVHEHDTFTVRWGFDQALAHEPNLRGDRGAPFAVYALARLKSGAVLFDVMSRAEVDAVRGRSRAGNGGPWVSDWSEMARKTVVRRLFKYLPTSVESADVLAAAGEVDGAVVSGFDPQRGPVIDVPAERVLGEVEPSQPDATEVGT